MAKKQQNKDGVNLSCRLNKVGGQAVLEGVMMKAGTKTVTTCRKPDGSLVVYTDEFHSIRKKNKFLNLPLIRGVVNFVEMMKLSFSTLSKSAEAMGLNDEPELTEKQKEKRARKLEAERLKNPEKAAKREEKERIKSEKKKARAEAAKNGKGRGIQLTDVVMAVSLVLGVLLAVALFIFLPRHISGLVDRNLFDGNLGPWISVLDGCIKIVIFLAYLIGVSFMKDIKRTFMYHGAEHKSIACFEAGDELTPENAKKYRRFHPRCGTSFMFFMILIGIIAGFFVQLIFEASGDPLAGKPYEDIVYSGIKLLLLPLVMGIGYEVIMFAGKHDNFFTRILSAPGLWVQRITTKEPTLDMLEVAIVSIKCALRDDFPEFREYWQERGWEKKPEAESAEETVTDGSEAPASEAETLTDEPSETVENDS